jgi:hypothetical protein
MNLNGGWTLTLFPTLPLALLAVVRITPEPSLMLVEEDSALNKHASVLVLPQQGYSIRTFDEQATVDQSGRPHLTPAGRIAVHRDLNALNMRMFKSLKSDDTPKVWNHVENLAQQELFKFPSQAAVEPDSATLRLPGCPGAVALLLKQENQGQIPVIAEHLGLHYRDAHSL